MANLNYVNGAVGTGTAGSLSIGYTAVAGNYILFFFASNTASGAITSVKDANSVGLTSITSGSSAGNVTQAYVYVYKVPAGGSGGSFSATVTNSVNMYGGVVEYSVTNGFIVISGSNFANANGNASGPTVSITIDDANDFVVGGLFGFTPAITITTGNSRQTISDSGTGYLALGDNTSATAGASVTVASTTTVTDWVALACEVRVAPIPLTPVPHFLGLANSGNITGTTTNAYATFGDSGNQTTTLTTTETNAQLTYRTAGVCTQLRINVNTNTLSSTAGTLTLRQNAISPLGGLSISIPIGVTGELSDASDFNIVLAGDKLDLQYSNPDPNVDGSFSGNAVSVLFGSFVYTTKRLAIGNGTLAFSTNSSSTYLAFAGNTASGSTTEINQTLKTYVNATLTNLFVNITANTRTNSSCTILSRTGTTGTQANGNLSVSIPASTTGIFEDIFTSTGDVDNIVASGSTINSALTTGISPGSITVRTVGVDLSTNDNTSIIASSGTSTLNQGADAAYGFPFGMIPASSNAPPSTVPVSLQPQIVCEISHQTIYLSASPTDLIMYLGINAVAQGSTLLPTAIGYYTSSYTYTTAKTDELCYALSNFANNGTFTSMTFRIAILVPGLTYVPDMTPGTCVMWRKV